MTTKLRQSYVRKIVDLDNLLAQRAHARANGKTVVHCHGCFDIVHPGHIRYLQFAKQQGDLLIVSLTGDPHVGKGEGRPYVPQELRAENLAALEFVDYVFINPDQTAVNLLASLKPDVYIKGREYEYNQHPGFLKERNTVESYGGRVIFSSGEVVFSSSHIIDNYASRLDLEQEKLALFCRRYDITRDSLVELLDAVVDRPFVVLGDTILDRYQYCDASDLAPDGPMMALTPLEHRDFLGGAAMLAKHLAGLGAEVVLITSFGTDDASDHAIDALEATGVHVLPMRNRKKLATRTRYVVDTQKLFVVDESPTTPTDSASERWLWDQLEKLGTSDTTLMLYDAALGTITDAVAYRVIANARSKFGPLAGGAVGSRGRLLRLVDADLLVASERTLRAAARDFEQGITALAYRLMADLRGRSLLVPQGKKGLLCFDAREDVKTGDSWEGKLRSEYLANIGNGTIDRLGFEEALLAIAGAITGAGGNTHQAAYAGLGAAILQSRSPGHTPLDGHELRQLLESRPEL